MDNAICDLIVGNIPGSQPVTLQSVPLEQQFISKSAGNASSGQPQVKEEESLEQLPCVSERQLQTTQSSDCGGSGTVGTETADPSSLLPVSESDGSTGVMVGAVQTRGQRQRSRTLKAIEGG